MTAPHAPQPLVTQPEPGEAFAGDRGAQSGVNLEQSRAIGQDPPEEGSRMGRSEEDIGKLCHGATLLGGLPVRGSAVKGSLDAVGKWIGGMNLSK